MRGITLYLQTHLEKLINTSNHVWKSFEELQEQGQRRGGILFLDLVDILNLGLYTCSAILEFFFIKVSIFSAINSATQAPSKYFKIQY